MEPLTTDEVNPPNPSAHPGAPYDVDGNCIHHPSVKLARLSDSSPKIASDSISWIIERKRCPKCCLNSIIHDTARKSDLGQSFLSRGGRSVTRSEARSVGGMRYSYKPAGSHASDTGVSVSCASIPYSFEEGLGNITNRKMDGSTISGADSISYYSRRGREKNENGFYNERRDPRSIPFRTPKDPSAASSSISSRMSMNRSNTSETSESPSYKPAVRHGRGPRPKRDLSPESKSSTIGMSTIPSADTSTCSTITMDTALFGRSQRGRRGGSQPYSSKLSAVRETDSRGRDPEESHTSGDLSSGKGAMRIPTQVHVPQGEDDKIILISNMPKDIGKDQDVRSVKSKNSREERSRKRGDDPSSRDDYNNNLKRLQSRDTTKSSRRRSQSWDGYENNRSSRHKSRRRSPTRPTGDSSYYSQPSLANTHSSRSIRSHYSRNSIRHDMDPNGYCSHHPNIRLMKPDEQDPSYWSVVRKKCPECIREDCPSVFEDRSVRSNYTHSTPFYDNGSVYSIESSKGSSFFMSLQTPEEIEDEEDIRRLKRRLAARAYHFPGNSWCEDWFQYISNTHTVLGLFFHHPLHPLKLQERLVILFGSIAIGLTISNLTYMHFIKIGIEVDEELFRVNLTWMGMSEVIITKLMLTLWTLGSFLHTVFDLGLWHMKACTLCRYGGQIDDKMARWGRVVGLFIVVSAMAAGSYAVLLRASIEYKGNDSERSSVEEAIRNNEFYEINFEGKRSFRFLLGYLVEFLLAMFVYYPIAVTILFSGVLGCRGRIPILGGRPRELKKEMNYALNKKKMLNTGEGADGTDETSDVYSASYGDDETTKNDDNRIV